MKLAIMQPYFFPYIGYWQLISAVDTFVIYDDVNYIKQGWINRNIIINNQSGHLISLQLIGASSFKLINEITIGNNLSKLLKTIEQTYKKAPYFEITYPLVQNILSNQEKNLAQFITSSIKQICFHLDITTKILVSSKLEKKSELRGQAKIIGLCKVLKASQYFNAVGGRQLYSKDIFSSNGLELFFINSQSITYHQFQQQFVANLSIIDILMFNDKPVVQRYLSYFEIV